MSNKLTLDFNQKCMIKTVINESTTETDLTSVYKLLKIIETEIDIFKELDIVKRFDENQLRYLVYDLILRIKEYKSLLSYFYRNIENLENKDYYEI